MDLLQRFLHFYILTVSFLVTTACATTSTVSSGAALQSCPGYQVSNVQHSASGLTADLALVGPACNVYGQDLKNLKLNVAYETASRLHVMIYDDAQQVYQVPDSVFTRPDSPGVSAADSALAFSYTTKPFSFAITRTSTGETLFNTSGSNLVFESQYVNLRTSLPPNPHLYGLGEHSDPFMLNTTNYTRTLWSRDAPDVPPGTNLYGNHPIYFDHRGTSGTHGVFLLNSNGMDIKINNTPSTGQYLEYNAIGGIVDLYFMAGPSPIEVSQQYGQIAGFPAMLPYWSFGFHQCRYGMQDVYEVAAVVANYSTANIPLETMWTDIDYMDGRKDFTLDPQRFPVYMMRQLVDYLHSHEQNYVMMVDPAISTQSNYSTFLDGMKSDVFLKYYNGSLFEGVVWPGVTAFPDWFAPGTQDWWNSQFGGFFDPASGVNIDGLWIDMNEASNFCIYPCSNPEQQAQQGDDPPAPPPVRPNAGYPIPGFPPDFQPSNGKSRRSLNEHLVQRQPRIAATADTQRPSVDVRASEGNMSGLPGRNLISPLYAIQNAAGALSLRTLNTNLPTFNGLTTYDTHNMYGTMMSQTSRNAMLSRRPGLRPLVITRSTFAGAGNHTGHWLGDNVSDWPHYLISMAQMLEFNSMFQLPMVGADVCGYNGNTTVPLCARWMALGAFSPFYRNHKGAGLLPQEAYRWPLVAEASRNAIASRFKLLDYFYTAVYQQTTTGTPSLYPLFFLYPSDPNTFAIQYQFFFGPHVLVSPVTGTNATSVDIYLPNDIFYDFYSYAPVRGHAAMLHLPDVPFTTIPLHFRGGGIIPTRMVQGASPSAASNANTTAQLRMQNFNIVIAPGLNNGGAAAGELYLDEGNMIEQPHTSNIAFTYDGRSGKFAMDGTFAYDMGRVVIERITLLGTTAAAASKGAHCNSTAQYCTFDVNIPFTRPFSMSLLR